jgi:Xaa-Pro dipeptidase
MIESIQAFLLENNIDGWLVYDFCGSNSIAARVLKIDPSLHRTRAQIYFVPKEGLPILLLHQIESHLLEHLLGQRVLYLGFKQFEARLSELLVGKKRVCMEISYHNQNPYVSAVPAGIVDLVRDLGVEVVSSADMLSCFLARWSDVDLGSHKRAAEILKFCYEGALNFIETGSEVYEKDVETWLYQKLKEHAIEDSHPPIIAFGENSANPHYQIVGRGRMLKKGDVVLIDLWGKEKREDAVFADITVMGFMGERAGSKERAVFDAVRAAQKKAVSAIKEAFSEKRKITGAEVDSICRNQIASAGYADYFLHRTGHNIDTKLHGPGTHLDSFETIDDRILLSSTCCSVEPGIYLPKEFGVRLELDLFIDKEGRVEVTTPVQDDFYYLFAKNDLS